MKLVFFFVATRMVGLSPLSGVRPLGLRLLTYSIPHPHPTGRKTAIDAQRMRMWATRTQLWNRVVICRRRYLLLERLIDCLEFTEPLPILDKETEFP